MWNLIKVNDEIMEYFPEYEDNQLPERTFMFTILCTLKGDTMKNTIKTARTNRSANLIEDEMNLISINSILKDELFSLPILKSIHLHRILFIFLISHKKFGFSFVNLATKGKANYLLKKGSILKKNRKEPRKFEINVSAFEENKDEEE